MTKKEFLQYLISCGCVFEPIEEHKAKVIYIRNPINGETAWIDLPIDNEYQMRDYTIYKICSDLGIAAPSSTMYLKALNDHIEDVHDLKRRRN